MRPYKGRKITKKLIFAICKKKDYEPRFEPDTIGVNSQDAYPLDYACYVDIGLNFK